MSKHEELERERRSMQEVREIMNSMKSLAYLEMKKLSGVVGVQHAMRESLEAVAADFFNFFPLSLEPGTLSHDVYLLVGSERGFCGGLNQQLVKQLEMNGTFAAASLLAVGQKLRQLLEAAGRSATWITGASVVEEVNTVLSEIVASLASLYRRFPTFNLYAIYHHGREGILTRKILPPFSTLQRSSADNRCAPRLYLSPEDFFLALSQEYLFSALSEVLFMALMAENYQRMSHLEAAVKYLDDELEALMRRFRLLRQEEIVEEIEVILLSTGYLDIP